MKRNSITKNYIYNVIYEILAVIIPLVTIPYVSRVLGAEKIGIYSYTVSIVTYFILFGSLGIAMYGKREIAFVQDNVKQRSKVFYEIIVLKTFTLFISMIIFYYSFCLNGEYSIYYRILLLEIIGNILDISWFFQGIEDFKKTVIRNSFVKIISMALIFILVKTPDDLYIYFLIYVLSTLFGNLSLWLYLPKFLNKVNFKELNVKKHIKPTLVLFIPQIATQVYTVLDKTMIGTIIYDKSEVGFYEQAQKVIKLLLTITTSLGTVMMPRIAATYAKGNKEQIKTYMKKSFSFILLLAFPFAFGISSIASHFVPIFYGPGYDKVIYIICVISPILVLVGLSNVTGIQYLLPTKQQNKYTISVVLGAVINFTLNLFLITRFGSIGASVATVIAEIVVTTTQFLLIRDQIKITEVFRITYKFFVAALIMFIISLIIGFIVTNDFISILIQVFISTIIYISILLIMKEKSIYEIYNRIKEIFNKKKSINK